MFKRDSDEILLRDGSRVPLRRIREKDADLLLRFFSRLSERSRYQRFMQHLPELPPEMLQRFTHARERELALAALDPKDGELIGVGRYAPNADGTTAEFALAVADAWQGKGVGRALLERLCESAREAGYEALYGYILDANREMLDLAARLGFVPHSRDGDALSVVRRLK
jgi:acetyltransferase